METAIRWAPSSTADDQQFLVVDIKGHAFKHCKVASRPDKFTLTYDVLASYSNATEFRSFDWSPAEENLVAVGHASGEVVVARLDNGAQAPLMLPAKTQRACHGLAWNTRGILAAGLDKFRGDHCLNIWDPNQRPVRAARGGTDRQVPDPLRKLANGEPVVSVKFFREQQNLLLAGMKGQSLRLYDIRDGPGNPAMQFSTRCIHHLAIDWRDENYFASCTPHENASICIWDRRSGSRHLTTAGGSSGATESGQALELKPDIEAGAAIWSLQYSQTQRGRLGMLTDTGEFRAYHLAKEYISEEDRATLEKTVGKDYQEPIYTKTVRDFQIGQPPKTRSEDATQRVAAFDFLNLGSYDLEAITILNDKSIAVHRIPPIRCPVGLSIQGAIARETFEPEQEIEILAPVTQLTAAEAVDDILDRADDRELEKKEKAGSDSSYTPPLSSRELHERDLLRSDFPEVQDLLMLMRIPKLRCQEGYCLNPTKNIDIVSDDPVLQDLWAWISSSKSRASNESMIVRGVDMNYLGVQSIWSGNLGLSLENRLASSELDDDVDVNKLIEELVEKLDLPEMEMCETDFAAQRKLCLRICNAIETTESLEQIVDECIENGHLTKAAALAAFQDKKELAFQVLRRNPQTQAHKLLAMAFAGATRGGEMNPGWEDTCTEIAKEITDCFARAILALVSTGYWDSILQETTLPLKFRVEVALRWLPDEKLSTYIRETTMEAVQQGDIEGIVLTGLDHAAMDLFQSYITKFNDIQTAVLVMSYSVPRFVSDPFNEHRFQAWRQTYRRQIIAWDIPIFRSRFDIASRNLATTWDGRKLMKPPPQQLRWKKLKALDVSFAEVVAAVSSSDKQRFGLLYAPPAGGAGAAAAPQADPAARAPQSQTPPETSARLPTTEDQQQQQQQQPVVSDDATAQAIAASAHDPDPHHYLIRARQGHSIKTVDASSLLRPLSAAANDDDRLLLPPTVVHGTYHAAWPQILHAGGLKCMGRNHVHFATGPPLSAVLPNGTAGEVVVPARLKSGGRRGGNTGDEGGGHQEVISGMRFDSQILIYIDVKKALAAGCPFWISENGVVLSEGMDSGSSGQQQQQQQQSQKLVGTEFFDVVVELRNGLGVIWENGALAPHVPDWMRAAPGPAPAGHGRARGKGRGREETIPGYVAARYYPVRIGEVFNERYQVVGKLGYGATSTVWLARDMKPELEPTKILSRCKYVTLKVFITSTSMGQQLDGELTMYKRLERGSKSHPGRNAVRMLLDSFEVHGPTDKHRCLVHPPLWESVLTFLRRNPIHRLPVPVMAAVLQYLFLALDYLHSECKIIHGDIKSDNIMLGIADDSVFTRFEASGLQTPCARKELDGDDDGRIIYESRQLAMPKDFAPPVLCDFGSAMPGDVDEHLEDIQPNF
ncbi:hypothetical protein LOZ67_003319 [Ophidiomyces ophidiicola]|nr:hypothetical protein LOZ50_006380 [Ophidiomyces ophidiicola]KAI2343132.1 hypothetical protein LOY92_006441 [Ophidiomyces ophidiicola]KAI2400007.1 hypothetical protein LOZ67_003319 [Ophidiomyces ophidiicola]KAI2434215.1 hypothetical protein LOZ08_006739 [Ophidiomyces ophidiicola]KAI2452947.1 hypothetical protein LOY86_003125 [Ophidiomyces ophidiicola]